MEKLKNIKIAFIDIDGTLTDNKKCISKETIIAIKNAIDKGLHIILCSGRDNRYVYNFSNIINGSDYFISCNGAEIFDYKNNTWLYSSKINYDNIKKIWDYCNENNISCILNGYKQRYYNQPFLINKENKILLDDIDKIKNIDIFQIVAIYNNFDKIKELDSFIEKDNNLKINNASKTYINKIKDDNYYFLDITNKEVNKGNAISELLNHLELKKDNAIGFGDHINDYDLFKEVGFKIAMKNADDKLKQHADYITLSNDENGVAHFLNNFIDYNN